MAAGMAKQRLIPVAAIYSSFLQRSYDMLIHDVSIQNLHVVLAVDRAGLVGEDGETHHGVFDPGFLATVPGMKILCPASYQEMRTMLRHAVLKVRGPVAVRYPKGGEGAYRGCGAPEGSMVLQDGLNITIVAYGTMVNEALAAARLLADQGYSAQILKLNSIAPLDWETMQACFEKTGTVLFAEECTDSCCVGRRILSEWCLRQGSPVRFVLANLGDHFVQHGTVQELRSLCGIDGPSLAKRALEVLDHG